MQSLRGRFQQNQTVMLLCVMVVTMMLGMGMVGPILPQYARTFGVSVTMVGLLITSFGVARLVVDVPTGGLADRIGRRPVLVIGPIIQGVGSLACGMAGSYGQLLLFRLVQGVGSAMYTTAAMIMLADLSTPANRGQIMSLYQGSLLLGAGLGPTVGGFMAQAFGLRLPFFIYAGLAFLAAVWGYFRLPETRRAAEAGGATPTSSGSGHGSPVAALGLLVRDRNFLLASMVTFGFFFMRTGAVNQMVPLIGADWLALTSGQIGVGMTLISVCNFATLSIAGGLSDRFGRKVVITPGCLVAAVALLVLAQSPSYGVLLLGCSILGIGTGISGPTPAAYVADVTPKEHYSSGMSLYRAIADLGFVIGPVLLGSLADLWGYRIPFYFTAVFMVLAAMLFQSLAGEPSRRYQEEVRA